MDISERIKFYRRECGLTQKDLGTRINKSAQVISNWERGYTTAINQDDILNLANAFSIPIEKLIDKEASLFEPSSQPTSPSTPAHSKRDLNDLAKFLNKTEVMFDGDTYNLSEEDQQKLRNALEFVFWDAKRKNKRKKD